MIGPLSTVLLIFGGCCSNVFALEAIIKSEPSSGLLITFFQFVFTTLASYPTQCSPGSPYTVRPPTVPLRRWVFIAALFFGINMLNNWAFAFSISVPVHIILRSFGSVTTMIMGVIRGKTYSALQVLSVMILTAGVLVSAWADSESKGKSLSLENSASTSDFSTGLAILLLAQLMSAWSGAYVEDTYAMYKASWTENLFYSHVFSLPMFLPLSQTLRSQYARLAASPPLRFDRKSAIFEQQLGTVPDLLVDAFSTLGESMPQGILFLLVNATTQLACISGVNLLSSKSSAVTVTIILNIRKLVSFIFSTILFGHPMSAKMIAGSALVFGSGALYGYETSWRLPAQRRKDRIAGEAESVSTKKTDAAHI
ncbi:golgi uridine diphosphate-N-acetylglucosamine transporter [Elasticomyces elasticus]|nr:golgi uridine diphosphate-N-acetylglucosamine transporter [Elasticomyces elasticus]